MKFVASIKIAWTPQRSVVFRRADFKVNGRAILILNADRAQFRNAEGECNATYDLRVRHFGCSSYRSDSISLGGTLTPHVSIVVAIAGLTLV